MIEPLAPRTIVEAFLPAHGAVPLAVVYNTANLAGVDDQPLRLTIRRMIAAGDVTQQGRGRFGTLSLTETGQRRLHRDRVGLALAFAQDAGRAPWDGRWRLVALSVPERDRSVRDALRRALLDAGAAVVSNGLYASPHELGEVLPPDALTHLATATTGDLDVRGTTEPRALTEMLWPSAPVITAYERLDRALLDDTLDSTTPVPVRQLRLADALERAIRQDPLIPLELRAAPWPPSSTRTAWGERWEALRQQASGHPIFDGW